jgi:serine/threonine protein kinase
MADRERCPNCGGEMAANAPQGLCPACLLRQGLESDDLLVPIDPESSSASATIQVRPSEPPSEGGGPNHAGPFPVVGPAGATELNRAGTSAPDLDATLSYSVARQNGDIEPLLTPQDLAQLANRFLPGIVLEGRYVLERELGRGAMGIVFLGRDNRLDRPVAIKVILPGDSGSTARGSATEQEFQDKFLQEARIGANLTHPAIATVHDFGYHRETPFTVFEYVAGPTLYDVIKRRRRLPLEEVRLVIGPLAQALDFAHSRFVVHRDLKPANIKAAEQGQFKILDLGLATEFRQQTDWSGFAGTPAYASPEQASGLPADGRSDQYALALITYEMLTGTRPFRATHVHQLLELHRTGIPPSPRSLLSDLSAPVTSAILRALEKDPQRRFASCCQFANALGCNLLSSFANRDPVIVRSDVNLVFCQLPRGHDVHWESLPIPGFGPWQGHIARTSDALWVAYRGEVSNWAIKDVLLLPIASRRKISVICSDGDDQKWIIVQFSCNNEAQRWHDDLSSLPYSSPTPSEAMGEVKRLTRRVIPLVRRSPSARFQVLGAVEATARRKGHAEAALILEGAVLGADLVADVDEEKLPGFQSSERRFTGYAMRTVDQAGKDEVAIRWFDSRIRTLTHFCFLMLLTYTVGSVSVGLALGVVPLGFVLALRFLRWPQLLWPTALILPAFGLSYAVVAPSPGVILMLINYKLARELGLVYKTYKTVVPITSARMGAGRRVAQVLSWILIGLYVLLFPGIVIASIIAMLIMPRP